MSKIDWESKTKKEKLKIFHFVEDGKLIGTIMYERYELLTDKIHFGISIVHPKEKGNKERGRQIAYGRLLAAKKGRVSNSLSFHVEPRNGSTIFLASKLFIITISFLSPICHIICRLGPLICCPCYHHYRKYSNNKNYDDGFDVGKGKFGG